MKGLGTKIMHNGDQIIKGYFENSLVNGKGLKKWR